MPVLTMNDANTAGEVAGATLQLNDATTIYIYALDPQNETEFMEYYQNTAVPWLKAQGMVDGKGWIVNHQLIYTALNDPPWNTMPGLDKYLSKEHPPVPQELPYTEDSGETYPTAQAS